MNTYLVSGNITIIVFWEYDVELEIFPWGSMYDFQWPLSQGVANILKKDSFVFHDDFEIDVEAGDEDEAYDIVKGELEDMRKWDVASRIRGEEEVVKTWIDRIDVVIDKVELVE